MFTCQFLVTMHPSSSKSKHSTKVMTIHRPVVRATIVSDTPATLGFTLPPSPFLSSGFISFNNLLLLLPCESSQCFGLVIIIFICITSLFGWLENGRKKRTKFNWWNVNGTWLVSVIPFPPNFPRWSLCQGLNRS